MIATKTARCLALASILISASLLTAAPPSDDQLLTTQFVPVKF